MRHRKVTDTRRQREIFVVLAAAGIAAALQEFVLKPGFASRLKVKRKGKR